MKVLFCAVDPSAEERHAAGQLLRALGPNCECKLLHLQGTPGWRGVESIFTMGEAQAFDPDLVHPVDHQGQIVLLESWRDSKSLLCRTQLSTMLDERVSFGLDLLANAGVATVPYRLLANSNDLLAFRNMPGNEEWRLHPEHLRDPSHPARVALRELYGETLHMVVFVSDNRPVKDEEGEDSLLPPLVLQPVVGVLQRGGVQDLRGLGGVFVDGPVARALAKKVRLAAQVCGIRGAVQVQLEMGSDGKALARSLRLAAPPDLLPLLFQSGLVQDSADTLFRRMLKDKPVRLKKSQEIHWALRIYDHLQTESRHLEGVPGVSTVPQAGYFGEQSEGAAVQLLLSDLLGWLTMRDGQEIPEALWEVCPTAQVRQGLARERAALLEKIAKFELEVVTDGDKP